MENSLAIQVKTKLNSNLDDANFSNDINNNKIIISNNDENQYLINIENNGLANDNENSLKIKVNFENCNNLKKNDNQKNKFERENVSEFSYIKYDIYEKLINENKSLIETIKNIEQKHNNEIKSLKWEIKRLKNNKFHNINNNIEKESEQNIIFNDVKTKEINELQNLLKNENKEINESKKEIFKSQENIKPDFEDFRNEKKQLEKENLQLNFKIKKIEYDYNKLKMKLENETNKNIINNFIINDKNKELNNFYKLFNMKNFNKEKIAKNIIDNRAKFNYENKYNDNDYGKVGIINHGFNCYMSSVIQILKNIEKFVFNILNYDKGDIITNSLRKVLINLYYSNLSSISIKEFNKDFGSVYNKFDEFKQNDSTTFLIYLIQHLNKVFKRANEHISSIYIFKDLALSLSEEKELEKFLDKYEIDNNSYINELFFGYQMNKLTCLNCEHSHCSYQSFIMLDLPLINENIEITCLEDALNSYLITKDKHKTKGFECSNCGKSYLSHLTSIIKLPKLLIINLKRVGENTLYYYDIKIPEILKTRLIEKLSTFNKQYALIGFIKRFGNEKNGHNIAFSKNIFDNEWYCFNDINVKKEKNFPSTDKSFLLFYQIIE